VPRGWGRHGAWSWFDGNVKASTAHSLKSVDWSYPVTPLATFGLSGAFDNWDAINAQSLGQPVQACAPAPARACRLGHPRDGRLMVVAWSTFGPHPIGCERFLTVSNGTSFAQATAAILGKQALGRTLIRMRSQVQVLAGPPHPSCSEAPANSCHEAVSNRGPASPLALRRVAGPFVGP
jgi:hypothetical protein